MTPSRRLFRYKWIGNIAVLLFALLLFMPALSLRGADTGQANGKAAQSGKAEAGKDGFLAAKHKAMGIDCAGCHKAAPDKPPCFGRRPIWGSCS